MNLSFDQKRFGLVILCALWALCFANDLLQWGFFGGYDRLVRHGGLLMVLGYFFLIGPSPEEMHIYRSTKVRKRGTSESPQAWHYWLTFAVLMLAPMVGIPIYRWIRREDVGSDDWTVIGIVTVVGAVAGVVGWRFVKNLSNGNPDQH